MAPPISGSPLDSKSTKGPANGRSSSPLVRRDFGLILFLTLVAALEFFLVRNYYAENVSPYFPRMWDQVATYQHVYRAHYVLRDQGFAAAFGPGGPVADLSFKSTLVPVLGTVLTFLFGPERFSIGLVNFLIFVGAQSLVIGVVYRVRGVLGAAAAWGLLLISQSHWINGLFDLRFDYAGLLAFGFVWVAIAGYLEKPTKRSATQLGAALAFCATARSITLIYALTTSGIVFGFILSLTLLTSHRQQWKSRLPAAGKILLITCMVTVIFIASQWFTLRSYYGSQSGTSTGEIRWAEVGVRLLRDRLIWYPLNWWPHFAKLLWVAGSALVVSLTAGMISKFRRSSARQAASPNSSDTSIAGWPWTLKGSALLLLAATIAIFVSSAIHGPNIAVLGMLTIPTAITVALAVDLAAGRAGSENLRRVIVGAVVLLGCADWTAGVVTARETNYAWRERGEVGQKVFEELAINMEARENPSVLFLWTHDIYNPSSFQVYQMETRRKLPAKARYNLSDLEALSPDWFRESIKAATCVVGYLKPPYLAPGQYEWPSVASIRKLQSSWQPMLERDFILAGSWRQPCQSATIGLWVRKVSFGHIEAAGLDWSTAGTPAFWVRPAPVPLELINATDHDLPVMLRAPVWPGPGREQTAQVELEVNLEGQKNVAVRLSPENKYDLRVGLLLHPGTNTVWLSAHEAAVTSPLPFQGWSVFLPLLFVDPLQPAMNPDQPSR